MRQTQDFKNRIKVSNPLNDIAANLGVTPKVLTQLATGDDQEFRELVRGIFSILPEDEVAMVATDPSINSEFLAYLSRLFTENQRILLTILYNPSANAQTREDILQKLPEGTIFALSRDVKAPSDVLRLVSVRYKSSQDILANLLANQSTPEDLKETIISESSDIGQLATESDNELEEVSEDMFVTDEPAIDADDDAYREGNVDAKIALCVDKLYEINANIVTEFIKKARSEIVKRLQLMARANRLILKTIVNDPSMTVDELGRIDMDLFASLLKKMPENIDDQTVLQLLKQARKK